MNRDEAVSMTIQDVGKVLPQFAKLADSNDITIG